MPVIRIPRVSWGKVWRFLVQHGPVSRIEQGPVYEVSEDQVRQLRKKKLPFEIISSPNGESAEKPHG